MATTHAQRTVRVFGLYRDPVNGTHLSIVRSGTWLEVVRYLNYSAQCAGPLNLFIENSSGKLVPLMS